MGLLHHLLPAVVGSALNPAVLGNEDRARWPAGTPTPSPQDSADALAWVLAHADGLEWLYERVDDDESRRVLLGRLAYAVLGHGCIVVGPGPERWTELVAQARAELLVEADLCDLHYGDGTHTHRFDLRPLGFPIDLEAYLFGAQGTLQLQQYRCPQHPAARIQPGDVVLDGDAFFGETALWAAHETGPDGRVIAVEFAEHNLPFLHRNLAANPGLAGRVEVVERALWDTSGEQLPVSLGGPATTVHDRGGAAYAAAHPGRVTVVHQANAGYVQATNVALSHARGDVLATLDADDLWPADKTRCQVDVLLERPEVGLVYSDTEIIDPYDAVTRPSLWRSMVMAPEAGPDCFATIMATKGNVALASTILFRRSILDHVAPLPARAQYGDWWITARAAQVSELAWVDGLHVGYRMHGANLTLGATGPRRVRKTLKTSEVRRQLLMAGGGAALTPKQLLEAYKAFEHAANTAVSQAASAYVPLPPVSDAGRARVDAFAFDPYDAESRSWVTKLAAATAHDPRPLGLLDGARGTVVLAHGDELVAEPGLLRAYAGVIAEDDDATLVIVPRDLIAVPA